MVAIATLDHPSERMCRSITTDPYAVSEMDPAEWMRPEKSWHYADCFCQFPVPPAAKAKIS
jgi:hypothetical protein